MGSCQCSPEAPGDFNANPAKVHSMFFPMYVVKVSDFLEMDGPLKAHDELQQEGLLHEWHPGMFVIFVSHQWLGFNHPDPQGDQAMCLRQFFNNIITGKREVESDIVTDNPNEGPFNCGGPAMLRDGYIFLDWFAIPQLTARASGVNEDAVKSDAAAAVQSIPAYVEVANLFVALVPSLFHNETKAFCNYASWLLRGWCRAELWCHVLSNKPDTRVILVYTSTEAEFMFPLNWQHNRITDGQFTVEQDREVVVQLGRLALQCKIQQLSTCGPLTSFRFYTATMPRLFDQVRPAWTPESFIREFRFPNFTAAVDDLSSMNGVLCAVFSGDGAMIRCLATARADVNSRLHGLGPLGYFDTQTPLMAALKSQQAGDVVLALLEMRADTEIQSRTWIKCTYLVRSPVHVQLLLDFRADFRYGGPGKISALAGAAAWASPETVKAILDAKYDPNNTNVQDAGTCLGHTPLHNLAIHSRDNPEVIASAKLLLEYRANVNQQARPSGLAKWGAAGVQVLQKFVKSRRMEHFAALPGLTPLGVVAWSGRQELAELLLEHHADLTVANDAGHCPEELARQMGQHHLLPLFATFHV